MLKVERLTKIYRSAGMVAGIDDANFALAPGAFFTLLGPSGCGKTTTLRCIAGLNAPDHGRITVGETVLYDGAKGINVPLHRRNIGMVFQSYAIWPHMSVAENVSFPMRVSRNPRYSRAEIEAAVKVALASVGLDGYGSRSATQLSGGQQQRVAFARAIVHRPKLLLLDEPLSNLDAALRDDMRIELKRLQQETGITAVYVTHDQSEALAMSDNIAVISKGHIVQQGTPRDIYFRPVNEFVASFIGHTNIMHGTTKAQTNADAAGQVDLGNGETIVCTFRGAMAAGEPIAVSVRPENIVLMREGQPKPADDFNQIAGEVIAASFLGNIVHYKVRYADREMQVEGNPDTVFQPGERVAMSFLPRHAIAVPSAP
ncbi:MAG TPA: ABC transporter ATP-binding protein [Devosia sp.]|nr:ABC transporter ATP-binding protein [Devosia sp.]